MVLLVTILPSLTNFLSSRNAKEVGRPGKLLEQIRQILSSTAICRAVLPLYQNLYKWYPLLVYHPPIYYGLRLHCLINLLRK